MPVKTCLACHVVFWARWGNTPAVCDACAMHATVCPGCWRVTVRRDLAQCELFSAEDTHRRPAAGVASIAQIVQHHFANNVPRTFDWASYAAELWTTRGAPNYAVETPPWPRWTSRAERLRSPFF